MSAGSVEESSGHAEESRHLHDPKHPNDNKVVHRYDDIEEYDNHLPNWWLVTLYGAIVFALVYGFHYHILKSGPSMAQSFDQEMAADRAAAAERARAAGSMTDESLQALAADPATVTQGRQVFMTNCVACHLASGGGIIGPNLTDNAWINGGRPTQIFHTVNEGVAARGMPAWGAQLGIRSAQSVTAFVLTLRNTNVAGGKAPQGTVEN